MSLLFIGKCTPRKMHNSIAQRFMKCKLPPKVNLLMSSPDQFSLEFLRPRTVSQGSPPGPVHHFHFTELIKSSSLLPLPLPVILMSYLCFTLILEFYILYAFFQNPETKVCWTSCTDRSWTRSFRFSPHGPKTSICNL